MSKTTLIYYLKQPLDPDVKRQLGEFTKNAKCAVEEIMKNENVSFDMALTMLELAIKREYAKKERKPQVICFAFGSGHSAQGHYGKILRRLQGKQPTVYTSSNRLAIEIVHQGRRTKFVFATTLEEIRGLNPDRLIIKDAVTHHENEIARHRKIINELKVHKAYAGGKCR